VNSFAALSNGRVTENNELERILKETALSSYGGTEKTTKSLRIADIPADIRTQHLPDTRLDCYRYANLLDVIQCSLVDRYRCFGGAYRLHLHVTSEITIIIFIYVSLSTLSIAQNITCPVAGRSVNNKVTDTWKEPVVLI
jgi:hypothetical protein